MVDLAGQDRLIVALDVPTHDEALRLVDELENVSFFKIGLTLFLAGDLLGLLKKLRERRRAIGGVFIDLKLAESEDVLPHRANGCSDRARCDYEWARSSPTVSAGKCAVGSVSLTCRIRNGVLPKLATPAS